MYPILLNPDFSIYKQINNFDSFIWNEKYRKLGDFQLRSYDVEGILKYVKLGSFMLASRSDAPMIVTNIDVGTDSQNVSVLTIRGVTLDYIFNHRPAYPYLGSTTYLDAQGPIEYGDKLGDVPSVHPTTILKEVINTINSGYGRLSQVLPDFNTKYNLGLSLLVDLALNSAPPSVMYYEITKDKTVMDVFNDMADIGGFTWRVRLSNSVPIIDVYIPKVKPPSMVEFNRYYGDYVSENASVSFDTPNLNIVSRYDDVVISTDSSYYNVGINPAFNMRIKTSSINDKEMSVYELNKATEESLVTEPTSEFVSENHISLETSGDYPTKQKVFRRGDQPGDFFLGDVVNVKTVASENLMLSDTRMQVSEFVRAVDSRGYFEYPVFQPFVKLGADEHPLSTSLRKSIKTYDWN